MNRKKPPPPKKPAKILKVSHARLQRWSSDSPFKSKCPACPKGILLVCRDQETFALINTDTCISCGQRVIYKDKFIAGCPVVDVTIGKN